MNKNAKNSIVGLDRFYSKIINRGYRRLRVFRERLIEAFYASFDTDFLRPMCIDFSSTFRFAVCFLWSFFTIPFTCFILTDEIKKNVCNHFSVRDGDTVKHYRIRQLDEGGFFISRRTTFRTLQELVVHYSADADGLCINLCKPCIQVF